MFKFKKNNIIIIVAILLILIIINYLFFKKNIENYYNTETDTDPTPDLTPKKYVWNALLPTDKKFNPTVITYNKRLEGNNAYSIVDGEIVRIDNITEKTPNNFSYNTNFKKKMKVDALDVAYYEHNTTRPITDIFALGSDNFMYHWRADNKLPNNVTPDFASRTWRKISFLTTNFSYSNRRCFIISNNSLYYFPNFLEGFKAYYDPSDYIDYFTKLGGNKINICPINVNLKQVCYNFNSQNILLLTQDGMIYYCKNNLNNLMMEPITWKLLETTGINISYIYLFENYLMYISGNEVYIHNLNNNKSVKIDKYPKNFIPAKVCVGGSISNKNNFILLQNIEGSTFYSKMIYDKSLQ